MKTDSVSITQIIQETTSKKHTGRFAVCWIKEKVEGICGRHGISFL